MYSCLQLLVCRHVDSQVPVQSVSLNVQGENSCCCLKGRVLKIATSEDQRAIGQEYGALTHTKAPNEEIGCQT